MATFVMFFVVVLSAFQSLTFAMFQKKYGGNSSIATSVFSIVEGIFVPVFTAVWVMFDIKVSTTSLSVQYIGFDFDISLFTFLIALFNAFALFMYNTFFIKASSTGSYAFLNVSMLFGGILVPIIYTSVFHNETVMFHQIVAIILMLFSFIVLNYKDFSFKGTKWVYFLYCLILFIANGAYSTFLKVQSIYKQSEFNEMILLTYVVMGVLAFIKLVLTQKKNVFKAFKMNKQAILFLVLGVFTVAFAMNVYEVLIALVNTAVLYTVNNGGVIVLASIFSIIFFKEKIQLNKIIGIIISIISIILLTISV